MIRKLGLPLLLLACIVAIGCGKSTSAVKDSSPPEVKVSNPVLRIVTDYEDFPGYVDAINTIQIKPQVQGRLTEVRFVDGQEVKQSDILAIIEQPPYKALLDAAEAKVGVSKANLASANADYRLAEASYNRTTGSVSQLDLLVKEAVVKQAEANLKLDQANLKTAQINWDYTTIRAEIGGRISRRYVDPGNVVTTGTTPTILTTIVSLDPVYAYFDIDERTMEHLEQLAREGKAPPPWTSNLPIRLGLANQDNFPFEGTINFADNVVNRQTGTLRVRGKFDNPYKTLSPGMFCRVQVPIGKAHPAVLVADKALGTDQGRKYLFVLNDKNEAVQRDVQVGSLHDGLRVVEGVDPKELIVVDGLQRVRVGKPVAPIKVDMVPEKGPTTDKPLVTNGVAGANGAQSLKK